MKRYLWLCLALAGLQFIAHAQTPKAAGNEALQLKDIFASGKFSQKSLYGVNPLNDGKTYASVVYQPSQALVLYDFASGKALDTLLKQAWLTPKDSSAPIFFGQYTPNADESMLLLSTDEEQIYRWSSRENNFLFDRKSKSLTALSPHGKQAFATFSPDGKKVAFMRNNNLFIVDLATRQEEQITFDGKQNEIINGGTDWVYEEEFGFTRAFFWSPDSKTILYYKFDEREVPEFLMPIYDQLYPTNYRFKYPKAGEKNAVISLHLYQLTSKTTKKIQLNDDIAYVARAGWTKDANTAWIQQLNRHQNKLELVLIDAREASSRTILTETDAAWVDVEDDLTFLADGKKFIWSSEKSGYKHLYLYDLSGAQLGAITQGDWDVTSFYGVDEKNGLVYFQAATPNPMSRELYSVKLDGSDLKKISQRPGKNSALFSKNFSHFINYHSDANTPLTVSVHQNNGKEVRMVQDNAALKKTLAGYKLAKKEFFSFTNSQGIALNGWMLKPNTLTPKKKYPVLMFVYGGPGSQTVDESFGQYYMWFQYLVQQGYVVVSVDNRGTGARGRDFKKVTYQQLGKYEIEDQIDAAKYLAGLPYVDAKNIAMFGWSYGGYMSSLAITKGADLFKAAVAVAPVINWRFYDTIYTERYMRTPQENASGYDDNSPSSHADKLKGAYLLIHGTADDNVHFQNAMVMVQKLVDANKQFDFMAYTDKNHGIGGGNTRLQLFTKITHFLDRNLK